jgi:putative hemolysin
MEIIIILLLVLLNGIFAMSEIALVSSRKVRLEERAKRGNKGARTALGLIQEPERFLSTVQIGMTLIGVISGAYGGATIAKDIQPYIAEINLLRPYASEVSFVLVIGIITYFSLVIGELVPKTLAFNDPEGISMKISRVMQALSVITTPLVIILSFSTKFFLKIFRVKQKTRPPVTEEELKILLEQGTSSGILETKETEMIKSIFRFGDRRAQNIMTPRQDIIWIDIKDNIQVIKNTIMESKLSVYPVCDDSLDRITGIISVKGFLKIINDENTDNLRSIITQPLFIPENLPAIRVLDKFRAKKVYTAVVINEYGSIEGLITLHDLIENIFGDLPDEYEQAETPIFRREDGSLLIDGAVHIDELREILNIEFTADSFSTLGGFLMYQLNKIPAIGDNLKYGSYKFEVVDMDGKRVDKVLVSKIQ